MKYTFSLFTYAALLVLVGCTADRQDSRDLVNDNFPDHQEEIREAILTIQRDIETANVEGLQAIHVENEKFTKFGPRSFERQDVGSTNESEATFFSSITNAKYETRDLKVDVFGDVGIATYYPAVSFERDGNEVEVAGRQTLVFVKTDSGWKLVHEHGTVRRP